MPGQHDLHKRQTSQYDKVLKENLELTLPVIIRDILHLNVLKSEEIPDDIQHTKERRPDALKKITLASGETFILHLEFQTDNDAEMAFRMAEYNIMLMRRYSLPVKQYVIYLRAIQPSMPTSLNSHNLKFKYNLICISDIDFRLFLNSTSPEVKALAVLANLGQEDIHGVVEQIVKDVQVSSDSGLLLGRILNQMRIFVQLRNSIEPQFLKAMQSVSTFFKVEKDVFYRLGEERGKAAVVENLLTKLGLSDEKAAEIAEVSIDFVKKVRVSISK